MKITAERALRLVLGLELLAIGFAAGALFGVSLAATLTPSRPVEISRPAATDDSLQAVVERLRAWQTERPAPTLTPTENGRRNGDLER